MKFLPTLDEAEVAVIGAGPAGAATAATLAQLGHEVVLIDQSRFPRDKPCGDGLWSGAVESLLRLGLDELVETAQPVEGVRFVRTQGGQVIEHRAAGPAHRPLPRCIPRMQLDAALLEAATNSGARFVLGRVQEIHNNDGRVTAVVVRQRDGRYAVVRAHKFVAADGATSRMRRLVGVQQPAPGVRAYAIRQYFRTEKLLEPFFEIQMPLRFRQKSLPGYAWIFPAAAGIANVGVGFYGESGSGRRESVSLRAVLGYFVDEIRRGSDTRYGDLECLSAPYGAPLAVNFSAGEIQRENTLFVGDAARMTDPLIGEGIAAALKSGEAAAREIDGSLRRGLQPGFGERMLRQFPRLGQDTRVVFRASDRFTAGANPVQNDANANGHPLLEGAVAALVRGSDDDFPIELTPVFRHCAKRAGSIGDSLVRIDRLSLDKLRTEFPFALDLLHRQFRAGAGPTVAATLILAETACGGTANECSLNVALADELLLLTTHFLGQVTDDAEPDRINLGNGFAMLISDFALSHGLEAAKHLGPLETISFARMSREVFEGSMAVADDSWALHCSADRYLAIVGHHSGRPHGHAAQLGAKLAENYGAAPGLAEFGHNLGVALRISNDVRELFDGDYPTGKRPGENLRYGRFPLPVIFALAEDPTLGDLLRPDAIEDARENVVERIRKSGAIARCVSECERYVDAAHAALEQVDLQDGAALHDLAVMAVNRCRASHPEEL